MSQITTVRRALLSVSDKAGLVQFARALVELDVELISTGGTARAIRDAGIPVRDVSELTGFPEIMDGRVKTLHPKIHGGILARRDVHAQAMQENDIAGIDLVCVNLYPFEETVAREDVRRDDAVEQIDIGGPGMIRAAAKNSDWVTVLTSSSQYPEVLDEMRSNASGTTLALRRKLAAAAFARIASYDAAIAGYLAATDTSRDDLAEPQTPASLVIQAERLHELRYGENPHQAGAVYRTSHEAPSIVDARQLHGKQLSYNNILDADAALGLAIALRSVHSGQPIELAGACVIKHTNPCGAAVAPDLRAAVDLAIAGDPLAAFGGILATNTPIDEPAAERICVEGTFFEVVIAPSFERAALERLRARWKNVRLLEVGPVADTAGGWIHRSVRGGMLVQQRDAHITDTSAWTHQAGPKVDVESLRVAAFLETCTRALTSNAIAIGGVDGKGTRLFGGGAGQMDRVNACRVAIEKAGALAAGATGVSDAFFPFSDGPQLLIDAGVKLIVHPGGSKRDSETFSLCDERGVSVYTTGVRLFRH